MHLPSTQKPDYSYGLKEKTKEELTHLRDCLKLYIALARKYANAEIETPKHSRDLKKQIGGLRKIIITTQRELIPLSGTASYLEYGFHGTIHFTSRWLRIKIGQKRKEENLRYYVNIESKKGCTGVKSPRGSFPNLPRITKWLNSTTGSKRKSRRRPRKQLSDYV